MKKGVSLFVFVNDVQPQIDMSDDTVLAIIIVAPEI